MYHLHPSSMLNKLFRAKPYQGADPLDAKFLFLGLDANYEKDLSDKWYFSEITDYLDNGVRYWQSKVVHHPFMLPDYKGDGKLYHRRFAEIGFSPSDAPDISFTELMHVPTVGQSKLKIDDLSENHLLNLNKWIFGGNAKYIFIPPSVYKLMRQIPLFDWLPEKPITQFRSLPVLYSSDQRTIFMSYHFSCVGKYCLKKHRDQQLYDIGKLK